MGQQGKNSQWLRKILRCRQRPVIALFAIILVAYFVIFDVNETEVDRTRMTHIEVFRNLTETRFQIVHDFCDSFGECFIVENRYWNESGKLFVERLITVRANPDYSLTDVELITPEVLTREYLNPMHWEVNKSVLSAPYNLLQAASGFMFGSLSFSDRFRSQRILQIGMGGGAISNYLAAMPVNLSIDVVELEPTVYDVAKRFFNLTENERVKVKIEDGVKFVERAAIRNFAYDAILLDACDNSPRNPIPCPTGVFRDPQVIENLSKIVGATGVLAVDMLTTRHREVMEKQIEALYQKSFVKCFNMRFIEEQNMLFCSNRKDFQWPGNKQEILARLQDFDDRMGTNVHEIVSSLNNYEIY